MNSIEYVKLIANAGDYVAPKYAIIESTIGGTLATSYVWLKSISYGFTDEADYLQYITDLDKTGPNKTLFSNASIGVYTVVALTAIVSYSRPNKVRELGFYPYG